jgi:CheY-like chemotaxis protein/anti-sigma regulatory factor (Ser/Thr protein kinase)
MPSVLVVDDSPVDRRLAMALLEKQPDLTVGMATHGAEALARVADQAPDIVVTDLQMPGMDGLELVRVLRGRHPLVPVILMTAHGNEEIAVAALEQGAASYVPKTKLAESLADTVQHVLAMAHANRRHGRLLDCLHRSTWTFVLGNDPALICPLVDYMQQQIALLSFCDESGRVRLGIALQEALLNALLHGNLELSSEQLHLALDGDPDLVRRRAVESPYNERRIHIYAELSAEAARFIIRDDGPGFDHENFTGNIEPSDLPSGRGLVLMRAFMDEVSFGAAGNEVTMTRYCDPDARSEE